MFSSGKMRYLVFFIYLAFISFLFCIPGTALPKNDWLSKIYFDKWIHIGIFLVLATICIWAFRIHGNKALWILLFFLAIYGILVELVQHYFIVNRSFDIGDWFADLGGSLLGIWLSRVYIKK